MASSIRVLNGWSRRLALGAGTASVAAIVATLPAVAASGAPVGQVGSSVILEQGPNHSFVLLAPRDGASKQTYDPVADASRLGFSPPATAVQISALPRGMAAPLGTVQYHCSSFPYEDCLYGNGSLWICPGSCADINAQFSSTVTYPGLGPPSTTLTFAGQADAYWYGSNPYDATTMDLSTNWWVSGWAVSVNLPGGSLSGYGGSGSSAYWDSGRVPNRWELYFAYNNVQFNGESLCCAGEHVAMTAQFGGSFYQTGDQAQS